MATCLLHPEHGYYTTRDPLGAAGDFTTAPEISQMFGEMIGLCLAQTWIDQGQPSPVSLTELGPGRGTLMADILRATRNVPGFHAACQVHLVEASPELKRKQSDLLQGYTATWHDSIDSLPDGPLFVVANEFFDALPVRQFQRDGAAWRERVIGVKDDALTIGLGGPAEVPDLAHRLEDTKDGNIVETCAPATTILAALSEQIASSGGAGLIIDYGDWRSLGDTLQALTAHKPVDPLAEPGLADLTTHVDFEALAQAAKCRHSRLATQGLFLERLGITARAQSLAKALSGQALQTHIAAHRRLTHPEEMGSLFKVLGIFPEHCAPLPGLEA
jgi:SAM-dependent MidA family methyltransferase